jgi:D-threo-aldose 1-dehydrogenase
MELKTHGIGGEGTARQPGPLERALVRFDVLLAGAAVVVEGDDALGRPRQVGDDETDARIKLAGVPLDLGHDAPRFLPALRLIGEAGVIPAHLKRRSTHRALSTKVGRLLRPNPTGIHPDGRHHPLPFDPVYDYSYDGLMRSFEDSFQRLGLARIDILYVHDIGVYQHGAEAHPALMRALRDSGYRALESLRGGGAVRAIGIGVNEREVLLEAMEWGQWDAFLLAGRYTLLEQAPLDDLLPKCVAAGTSIVVGGPLNSGILAGRDTWNYNPAPPAIIERVKAIEAVCDAHAVPLPAAALQFPLAHPAVAAIIPGPRNADEFRANLGLLRHPIPAALWADLRQAGLLHPDAPVPN